MDPRCARGVIDYRKMSNRWLYLRVRLRPAVFGGQAVQARVPAGR